MVYGYLSGQLGVHKVVLLAHLHLLELVDAAHQLELVRIEVHLVQVLPLEVVASDFVLVQICGRLGSESGVVVALMGRCGGL